MQEKYQLKAYPVGRNHSLSASTASTPFLSGTFTRQRLMFTDFSTILRECQAMEKRFSWMYTLTRGEGFSLQVRSMPVSGYGEGAFEVEYGFRRTLPHCHDDVSEGRHIWLCPSPSIMEKGVRTPVLCEAFLSEEGIRLAGTDWYIQDRMLGQLRRLETLACDSHVLKFSGKTKGRSDRDIEKHLWHMAAYSLMKGSLKDVYDEWPVLYQGNNPGVDYCGYILDEDRERFLQLWSTYARLRKTRYRHTDAKEAKGAAPLFRTPKPARIRC